MRMAKGKRITAEDRRELETFATFVRAVHEGKPQAQAYAELYGEVVFDASRKDPA